MTSVPPSAGSSDPASQAVLSRNVASNPAFALIFGSARDLTTAEGFNDWRAPGPGGFSAGLMAIFIVVRHSRGDEDSGQAELIASGVVSRHTRLMVAVALRYRLGRHGRGHHHPDDRGRRHLPRGARDGATYTASGLMFAGVGAVAAQVGSTRTRPTRWPSARSARSSSSAAISTRPAMRTGSGSPRSAGPSRSTRRPTLRGCGCCRRSACQPCSSVWRTQLPGAARLRARAGPADTRTRPRRFPSPLAAVARLLHGPALLTWALGFVVIGAVFGFIATSLGEVFGKNPMMAAVLASGQVTTGCSPPSSSPCCCG